MQFEWDDEKEKINIIKHGIAFKTAELVFGDENRIEIYDEAHSTPDEDRYITIGLINEVMIVVTVVYTPRGNNSDIIRLISARKATKSEREEYYNDRNTYM